MLYGNCTQYKGVVFITAVVWQFLLDIAYEIVCTGIMPYFCYDHLYI